ncbi:YdbH domain-containing protein [Novosphingobium album (ex Liu et al. 2023)]|uniref:YdbH domain-containing protein n=1 Tax=Novosphingobium album (ex Liu et al. 2023) TaxID=3031130 RepID=A0ABT5WND7_9SPHN|nr:YdbH domain-containing protein [Novosphingobium album (ex Liu et al. 2023)]MDE8651562.1 YdbH domain-containing protein [Novosphingobium album (ex Liu et al. 2023)]
MAQDEDLPDPDAEAGQEPPRRRGWRRWAVGVPVALALALGFAWISRERIADDFLAGQLEGMGLPATYRIARISPDEQVLRDVVIGDPARPDLTIAEVRVRTRLRFGLPGLGRITLVRPRLWGSVHGGKPSFGSLDKVLFTGGKAPFRLPDLDVAIEDGRALIESDYGPLGVKVEGKGPLRGGFAGALAVLAPQLAHGTCRTGRASLYGTVTIAGEKPRLRGPLRLAGLDCPDDALKLAKAGAEIDITLDQPLDGGEGRISLAGGALALGQSRLGEAKGTVRFTYRKGALTARHDLKAQAIVTPQARLAALGIEGRVRAADGLRRIEVESDITGSGLAGGGALLDALARAQAAGEGTLAVPLLTQIRAALARETRGSRFAGSMILRRAGKAVTLVVPRAALHGGSGQTLVALSRVQLMAGEAGLPRITGNFATGGKGLPAIAGRMERGASGGLTLRVRMPEYRAGDARIALPELALAQAPGGAIGFAGEARLTGALPGGRAENLVLPLDGNWSARGALALWRSCVDVRFDRLEIANLRIDKRRLPLCPPRGRAIVQGTPGGSIAIAAGVPALDLSGRLGQTPIRIASGPVGFAWPGTLTARALDIALGPAATASRFRVAHLDARVGREISGTFDGSDVLLAAVPLDLRDTGGTWRYADGVLTLGNGAFRLEDREQVDRFAPLLARDATLTLKDNVIDAEALLREPASGREVVLATIRHDLTSGRGHADLAVPGILFDNALQPDTLTPLALGVVANAQGTVRGRGRIDWDENAVTSNGSFTTDALDFAAAFGPVRGLSGTVAFTDLLGLVTAPRQRLDIAAINPGIEVYGGVLFFDLKPGYVVDVEGGNWPFLGGTLRLQPVTMRMGVAETRRYVLDIEGLDAAQLVERMELANLSATGTFDGTMPLVFDENGGRIVGGRLTARPPGGNVSYIGELTYKDLSAMANFAFDALKSLDYRQMEIGMEGALEGEIVTRVQFLGIKQGQGTSSNFLTRRIAKLPIRFNVNLRAPFFQLASSFRSFYDPAYVRDPRGLGLIDAQGRPIAPAPGAPAGLAPPQPPIQPSESAHQP